MHRPFLADRAGAGPRQGDSFGVGKPARLSRRDSCGAAQEVTESPVTGRGAVGGQWWRGEGLGVLARGLAPPCPPVQG